MTEGTKSLLFGCHQFFMHPFFVLIAWVKEYRSWPRFWELVCIVLHDVGHIGKQYLSDPSAKAEHWKLGAQICGRLFGQRGFEMVAGHVGKSGFTRSKLFIPDKRSWLETWDWWMWATYYVEFSPSPVTPPVFKRLVAENLEKDCPKDSHDIYLETRGELE